MCIYVNAYIFPFLHREKDLKVNKVSGVHMILMKEVEVNRRSVFLQNQCFPISHVIARTQAGTEFPYISQISNTSSSLNNFLSRESTETK